MIKQGLKTIYDDAQFFNSYIELRSRPDNYNDLIEQPNILRLIGDIAGKKVLDIGCGFGTLTAALSGLKPLKIIGIDISSKMLELAQRINTAGNIEYRQMDAGDIDKIREKFDLVCSSLTFHYIEDLPSLARKIRKVLNRKGELVFSQEHPLLTAGEMGVTVSDLSQGISVKSYSQDGERRVKWLGKEVTKYHRKLSAIFNALTGNGFIVKEIAEPVPPPDLIEHNKLMLAELQRPSYLMIKATRG